MKRPHRKIVGATVVEGKLFCEVIQGKEGMGRIETFLVFPVTALHFTIMPGSVRANELVPNAEALCRCLKQSRDILFAVREAVGKLKSVVSLNTLYPDSPACVPFYQFFQEISGGVGGLFRIGGQKAQPGELINGSVLEQAQFRI